MSHIIKISSPITILSLSILASGCTYIRDITMPPDQNLLSGAGSLMMISPSSSDKNNPQNVSNSFSLNRNSKDIKNFEQIDVTNLFKDYGLNDLNTITRSENLKSDAYRYRRNEMQNRIIAASNQRCGMYIRTLVSVKAQSNTIWGGMAALLSGAASVVTPASLAKSLAAGSTFSNATLNNYNEGYFNNLTVNIIASGITNKRKEIMNEITTKQKSNLVDYTPNMAIADAAAYHASCNILAGLEAAAMASATKAKQNTEEAVELMKSQEPKTE